MQDFVTADIITMQLEKSVGRNSIVTISELDRSSLNPATYINGNVIDFWMLWLTRHISTEVCPILFFTSHFYSSLLNEKLRLQHVSGWMQGRKLDFFSKDVLVFPINGENHWSLMVLYYPGLVWLHVDEGSTDNRTLIMMHLDSLKYHNGYHIAKNIRTFLN
jgi:Ulp1 family protease